MESRRHAGSGAPFSSLGLAFTVSRVQEGCESGQDISTQWGEEGDSGGPWGNGRAAGLGITRFLLAPPNFPLASQKGPVCCGSCCGSHSWNFLSFILAGTGYIACQSGAPVGADCWAQCLASSAPGHSGHSWRGQREPDLRLLFPSLWLFIPTVTPVTSFLPMQEGERAAVPTTPAAAPSAQATESPKHVPAPPP